MIKKDMKTKKNPVYLCQHSYMWRGLNLVKVVIKENHPAGLISE